MAASLIRNRGLDLPIYHTGTDIIYGKANIKAAAREGGKSFVRGTLLSILSSGYTKITSLEEALRVADEGFTEVARGCGAIVLQHSWGLYNFRRDPGPENTGAKILGRHQGYSPDKELIPKGHILVAEVEVIQPLKGMCELTLPDSTQRYNISASFDDYRTRHGDAREAHWLDCRPEQFINGMSPSYGPGLVLGDIEPKLTA